MLSEALQAERSAWFGAAVAIAAALAPALLNQALGLLLASPRLPGFTFAARIELSVSTPPAPRPVPPRRTRPECGERLPCPTPPTQESHVSFRERPKTSAQTAALSRRAISIAADSVEGSLVLPATIRRSTTVLRSIKRTPEAVYADAIAVKRRRASGFVLLHIEESPFPESGGLPCEPLPPQQGVRPSAGKVKRAQRQRMGGLLTPVRNVRLWAGRTVCAPALTCEQVADVRVPVIEL
ncbi:hypothetical protein AAFF_G00167090 [Aldrovandia affinis]|uniref:Uncharacterized protein n=1 Tax=Aldrovandia affinis TaxID=143900 RepID=A0AAD7W804_9TELE|nr:hypothetical protein AAFF_G00167090 [Aldrovandia affinis]